MWGTFPTCRLSTKFRHDDIVLHEVLNSLFADTLSLLQKNDHGRNPDRAIESEVVLSRLPWFFRLSA
jgi:hypothetical protein